MPPELYAVCDAGRGRVRRRPIEGREGDVDGGDVPAAPGEPDRVAPLDVVGASVSAEQASQALDAAERAMGWIEVQASV